MTLLVQQLIDLWGPPQAGSLSGDAPVGQICTDSRQLVAGGVFVPLVGERFDGHAFLSQIQKLRPQAALIGRSWDQPLPKGLVHWRVNDTLAAYQQLGLLHRRSMAQPSSGDRFSREILRELIQRCCLLLMLTVLKQQQRHWRAPHASAGETGAPRSGD